MDRCNFWSCVGLAVFNLLLVIESWLWCEFIACCESMQTLHLLEEKAAMKCAYNVTSCLLEEKPIASLKRTVFIRAGTPDALSELHNEVAQNAG